MSFTLTRRLPYWRSSNLCLIEAHLCAFFSGFYALIPVFTEAEFRADLAVGRIPRHLVHAVLALGSLHLLASRSSDALPTDRLAASAHALVMPQIGTMAMPGIHESATLTMLAVVSYLINDMATGRMYVEMAAQPLTGLANNHDPASAVSETFSRLFWSAYLLDRIGACVNSAGPVCATPLLSLEAVDVLPPQPRFADPPGLLLAGTKLYATLLGDVMLMSRVELWIRTEWRARHHAVATVTALGPPTSAESLASLHRAAHAWRASAAGDYAMPGPDASRAAHVLATLSPEAAEWWLFANLIFINAAMYIEPCPRERWCMIHTVLAGSGGFTLWPPLVLSLSLSMATG
ncbi:hypothetical protein H9P43_001285 [Blastocladiella emersonii ATCC 22665]|nr:hypothetical protein H9P43_001285 [Blastocladiella emersonii ATCC 22665]